MSERRSSLAFRLRFLTPDWFMWGGAALIAGCSGEASPLFAQQSGVLGGAPSVGGSMSALATGGSSPLGNTGASGNQPNASGGSFSAPGGTPSAGGARSTGGASSTGGTSTSVGGSGTSGNLASGGTGGAGVTGGTGGASQVGGAGNQGGTGGSIGTGGEPNCVPRAEICDGLDNNCTASTADEVCPADCVGRSFQGKGYMFCSLRQTWVEAVALCQASAARTLVQVEDIAENNFVLGVATELGWLGPWLGASDAAIEGDWRWVNGTKFWTGEQNGSEVDGRFSLWTTGNPNNGEAGQDCAALCVQMNDVACSGPGVWNDVDCTATRMGVVCE